MRRQSRKPIFEPVSIEEFLMEELPREFRKKFMEDRMCFRTEVRETDVFICGVHTGSGVWRKSDSFCPESVEAVTIMAQTLYSLSNDYYEAHSAQSRLSLTPREEAELG